MSNAPQGPGWWQASDGNWYPPEQHPGYTPPPPTEPSVPPGYRPTAQSSETPATQAAPQYPPPGGYPASGGQAFGNAQSTFAAAVAKAPLALWLFVGGLAVALISLFLPWFSASGDGISVSISLGAVDPAARNFLLLALIVGFGLAWATYARPQMQRGTLIGLSVVVGLLVLHLIYNWITFESELAKYRSDLAGVDVSPGLGFLLYGAALAFLAVRIVMVWRARSNAQPQAF